MPDTPGGIEFKTTAGNYQYYDFEGNPIKDINEGLNDEPKQPSLRPQNTTTSTTSTTEDPKQPPSPSNPKKEKDEDKNKKKTKGETHSPEEFDKFLDGLKKDQIATLSKQTSSAKTFDRLESQSLSLLAKL